MKMLMTFLIQRIFSNSITLGCIRSPNGNPSSNQTPHSFASRGLKEMPKVDAAKRSLPDVRRDPFGLESFVHCSPKSYGPSEENVHKWNNMI